MIRTLLFVLAAALVIAGVVWLAGYPGEVRFTVAGWEIAAPVPLVAACILLIAVAAALLYRLWRGIRRTPADMRGWLHRRRRERGYRALTHGMVAVAAGDAEEARRQAQRADSLLGEPPLTMLLSAQAAQLNGDEDAARRYFTAMLEREETAFLGLRGLLIQAQRAGDRGEALQLAQRAHALRPKTPWVLTTLLDLQVAERNWREALATLDQAIRRGAIKEARGRHLRTVLLLGCSQAAEAAGDRNSAFGYARKAQGQRPDYLPATLHLATMSAAAGRRRATLRLIEDAWSRTPHPALAELYASLGEDGDALKTVRRVETLAARNPGHPESHIAVGRAMMDAQIWGASRSHLESAAGGEPSARICRLMAELEERERGDLAASHDWLLRAANAAPDPAWICSACGAAFSRWTPVCDRCGALGTQEWKVPARARAVEFDGPAPALPAAAPDSGPAAGNGEAPRPPSPPATRPPGQPAPAE